MTVGFRRKGHFLLYNLGNWNSILPRKRKKTKDCLLKWNRFKPDWKAFSEWNQEGLLREQSRLGTNSPISQCFKVRNSDLLVGPPRAPPAQADPAPPPPPPQQPADQDLLGDNALLQPDVQQQILHLKTLQQKLQRRHQLRPPVTPTSISEIGPEATGSTPMGSPPGYQRFYPSVPDKEEPTKDGGQSPYHTRSGKKRGGLLWGMLKLFWT